MISIARARPAAPSKTAESPPPSLRGYLPPPPAHHADTATTRRLLGAGNATPLAPLVALARRFLHHGRYAISTEYPTRHFPTARAASLAPVLCASERVWKSWNGMTFCSRPLSGAALHVPTSALPLLHLPKLYPFPTDPAHHPNPPGRTCDAFPPAAATRPSPPGQSTQPRHYGVAACGCTPGKTRWKRQETIAPGS